MKKLFRTTALLTLICLYTGAAAETLSCFPLYSSGCVNGDGLILFKLNSINKVIPCTVDPPELNNPAWLHNYSGLLCTCLMTGHSYTITVQAAYSDTYVTFWIDYNQDNVFNPATETIGQIICTLANTNYSMSFTVPGDAAKGFTRLRAMTELNTYPEGPCSQVESYGNCSMFSVNISPSAITETIPTLSQWGLIMLAVSLLALGSVFILKRQYALIETGKD
jgi:hypothetical protein